MSHQINGTIPSRPAGRPKEGAEKRSVFVRFRIEPYLDRRMNTVCRCLGIPKSEGIRRGIQLFIREAERIIYQEDVT